MKTSISVLAIAGIALIATIASGTFSTKTILDDNKEQVAEAVIYKSPSCGCCGKYAAYLREEDYDITIEGKRDMQAIKEQFLIPYEVESCHTMKIAGYVVEGHIPELVIKKLLSEKPDIAGIGMAGMPSGSPGMPGIKNADFIIYTITHDGKRGEVYMTI
ncbi:MAG: DUF411 domain-containing protein [Patescibacteria group bacterium]